MIRYGDSEIIVRDMLPEDIPVFVAGEQAQGWNASPEKLENRLRDRENGLCELLTAELNGEPAGYVSVYWNSPAGAFAGMGIPEIVDLNVLEKARRRGVGGRLMDVSEALAAQRCDRVCIGVGLHSGYGSAQRLYVRRGYLPDGTGVWYRDRICGPYENCCNDDDLVLYLSKSCGATAGDESYI